jgi:dTDP-4-dehydrorhamnose 3,5-epimerase
MIRRELETEDLPLKGAFVIKPKIFEDERGVFIKIYDRAILNTRGVEPVFPEDYISISKKGVIRGLHYQLDPHSQAKLVRVVKGSVLDVLVDLRKSSPTFGKWASVTLSEENGLAAYVPRGFAHGYLALEDGTAVTYKVDNDYAQAHERGIRWDDPKLGIRWPKMESYIVSQKDKAWPTFESVEKF